MLWKERRRRLGCRLAKDDAKRRKWSFGRPVFKKVDGEPRFLFVPETRVAWSIKSSTTAFSSLIRSGRGTNDPSSPQAAASVRTRAARWRYLPGKIEGDISVTCPQDS